MTDKDMNQCEFEGDITSISNEQLGEHYMLKISIRNHPFLDMKDYSVHITLYAYDGYAKYLESQLSINDRVMGFAYFLPLKNNNAYLPWFRIKKIFISKKYFGLNLELSKDSMPT